MKCWAGCCDRTCSFDALILLQCNSSVVKKGVSHIVAAAASRSDSSCAFIRLACGVVLLCDYSDTARLIEPKPRKSWSCVTRRALRAFAVLQVVHKTVDRCRAVSSMNGETSAQFRPYLGVQYL